MFASLINSIQCWAVDNGLARSTKPVRRMFDRVPARILISGLDAAGKTTALIRHLSSNNGDDINTVIPFIGFIIEQLRYGQVLFEALDVGGGRKASMRRREKDMFLESDALIWMVDSSGRDRKVESIEALRELLNEDDDQADGASKKRPVLILMNKRSIRDSPGSLSPEQLMSLDELKTSFVDHVQALGRGRRYYIAGTDMNTGHGLADAFAWLSHELLSKGRLRKKETQPEMQERGKVYGSSSSTKKKKSPEISDDVTA
ncbi:ADP-ribosylation factor family-domain-containing protein [Xylariaceae sp. FL0255]|nr:ADP-ribosylation factor family-domain-containing protein [Xylariaceae sp. FL0255]